MRAKIKIKTNFKDMYIQMPNFQSELKKGQKIKNCLTHNFIYVGKMWAKGDKDGNIYLTKVFRCECGKNDFEYVRMEPCPKGKEHNKLYQF